MSMRFVWALRLIEVNVPFHNSHRNTGLARPEYYSQAGQKELPSKHKSQVLTINDTADNIISDSFAKWSRPYEPESLFECAQAQRRFSLPILERLQTSVDILRELVVPLQRKCVEGMRVALLLTLFLAALAGTIHTQPCCRVHHSSRCRRNSSKVKCNAHWSQVSSFRTLCSHGLH